MKDPTIRRILAFFLLISAVLVGVAVEAVRNIDRSAATSDWVNHTHSVVLEADGLRTALYRGEAALQTYLRTNDARDLADCRTALSEAREQLEIAQALTRFEPAQAGEIAQLAPEVDRRLSLVQAVLAAAQAGDRQGARAQLAADAGGAALAEAQQKIGRMKNEELALLTERDRAAFLQAQATRWTVWTGVALDVLLLGGVAWLIRDDLAARRRVAAALREANEQLEARVRERTAELAAANSQLSTENLERKWANQALEHQLRYHRLMIDSIGDLVLVITKTQKISRVNPAVVRLTGRELNALIDRPLSGLVRLVRPEGADPLLVDPVAQALKEGHDLRDQPAIVEDRQGRQTSVRFAVFPLRDRDKIVGGIVTLRMDGAAPGTQA